MTYKLRESLMTRYKLTYAVNLILNLSKVTDESAKGVWTNELHVSYSSIPEDISEGNDVSNAVKRFLF